MLRALQGDDPPAFVYLLNPDTRLEPGAIMALRQAFDQDAKVGCAGSQLINKEGGAQPAGFRIPNVRIEFARGARAMSLAKLLLTEDAVIDPQITHI